MQTKLRSTAEVDLNTNNNCFVAAETGQDEKMRQERSEKNIQLKDQKKIRRSLLRMKK